MSKALTIGEVAAVIGLSAHTLRYYEQTGLLKPVGRSGAGHRLYSPADLDWLRFVMRLRATGMPIAQMQAFAALRAQGDATYDARREMLAAHREAVLAGIAQLQDNLAAISDKIDWYEEAAKQASGHDEPSQPSSQDQESSCTPSGTTQAPGHSKKQAAATRAVGRS
jgi:DNA-binding transcriptional MerR regulator